MIGTRPAVWQWGTRIGYSAVDQAVTSGATFFLNVMLIRVITPADYGWFTIAYSVFLFLSGFHNALVLEPLTVLGSGYAAPRRAAYLHDVFGFHTALTVALALPLAATGTVLAIQHHPLGAPLVVTALATPLVLLQWLVRRVCYLHSAPSLAARSSVACASVLLVLIAITGHEGLLTAPSALLILAIASVVGAAAVTSQHGASALWRALTPTPRGTIALAASHWRYGRWLAATSVLALGSIFAQTFLTAAIIDVEAAGTVRALQLFTLPLIQLITAVGLLGLPALSRDFAAHDMPELRRKAISSRWASPPSRWCTSPCSPGSPSPPPVCSTATSTRPGRT